MIALPLIQLWDKRGLIFHFAFLSLKLRFKNTYLGFLWAALEPLFYFVMLYVVFTSIREVPEHFEIYLMSGIILFHVFARGTSGGLSSLTGNGGILKSLKFKKEFFPVVATVAIGLLAFVDVGVFLGLMPVFQFTPSLTLILLPLPLILLLILILGLSYFLSIVTIYVRDVQFFWSIFTHSLLFVSPIFWSLETVKKEILLQIHQLNPLGQLIEITHHLVIYGDIPPLSDWLYTTAFILAIFFTGYFVFHKFEDRITEIL